MNETKEIDIDLRKIFYMMRTKVVFILLATIVFASAAGIFTHFFIAPTYTATARFFVYNNPDNNVSTNRTFNSSDIDASNDIINTYVYLLKSDTVLDKVAQELGYASGDSIKGYISASPVEGTLVFQVKVSTTDPVLSAKIANTVANIAPDEIVRIVNAGGASVVDYAKQPKSPSEPNIKKNILIGAVAGFFLSFAGFFIYEMFDTTITLARDLEREFDTPVLGTIPRLDAPGRSNYGNYNKKAPEAAPAKEPPGPPLPKPSNALLENIQSVKEGNKNDNA